MRGTLFSSKNWSQPTLQAGKGAPGAPAAVPRSAPRRLCLSVSSKSPPDLKYPIIMARFLLSRHPEESFVKAWKTQVKALPSKEAAPQVFKWGSV